MSRANKGTNQGSTKCEYAISNSISFPTKAFIGENTERGRPNARSN